MRSVLGYFRHRGSVCRAVVPQVVSDCLGGEPVSFSDESVCLVGGEVGYSVKKSGKGSCHRGRVCVFSGELLNREDLCQRYHLSAGASSAELCLQLQRHLGEGFASILSGPFLAMIYDCESHDFLLYRDQLGQHPLYYSLLGNGHLLFGDDLHAMLRLPGCPSGIDLKGLTDYLSLGYVPAPGSIYRGIRKLRPGCYLHVRARNRVVVEECYWRPIWSPKMRLGYEDAVMQAEDLLRRSVRRCRRAHSGCGVLLSGGLDSNLVAACGAGDGLGALPTYTVGFEDSLYDERKLARESAQSLGVENESATVTAADIEMLDGLERLSGEPFGDSSLIPTVKAMALGKGAGWLLTGSGGDEVFGGYRRYQAMCWRSLLRIVPQCVLSGLSCLGQGILPGYGETRSRLGTVRRALQFLGRGVLAGYGSFQEVFSEELKAELLSDRRLREQQSYLLEWKSFLDLSGSHDRWLEQFNSLDLAWYLPDDGCRKEWLASRYAGVGKLSPILDREVVEFGLRLPGSLRVTRGGRKRVLAGVGRKLLCASITEQHGKRGFGVPVASWFRGPCRQQLTMLCDGVRDWDCHGWFDEQALRALALEHDSGRVDHGARLWNLWCLRSWLLNR